MFNTELTLNFEFQLIKGRLAIFDFTTYKKITQVIADLLNSLTKNLRVGTTNDIV